MLKLSGCWSRLLVHLVSELIFILGVVVLIVRVTLLGLLLGLCFRLAFAFLVVFLLVFNRIYGILLLALALLFVCLSLWRLLDGQFVFLWVRYSSVD